jgi:hypothetical protein
VFPPVDGFGVGGHAVEDAGDELGVAAPAAAEAELLQFPGGAVVVVDRLIYAAGVDLADPVAVDRRCDVAEQSGQLRLVVGADSFAGDVPFGPGAHDWGRYRLPADPARVAADRASAGRRLRGRLPPVLTGHHADPPVGTGLECPATDRSAIQSGPVRLAGA